MSLVSRLELNGVLMMVVKYKIKLISKPPPQVGRSRHFRRDLIKVLHPAGFENIPYKLWKYFNERPKIFEMWWWLSFRHINPRLWPEQTMKIFLGPPWIGWLFDLIILRWYEISETTPTRSWIYFQKFDCSPKCTTYNKYQLRRPKLTFSFPSI